MSQVHFADEQTTTQKDQVAFIRSPSSEAVDLRFESDLYLMFKRLRFNTWARSEDPLEEEMATHSSILAWEIPWTGEPGGLLSMGSHRVGHD